MNNDDDDANNDDDMKINFKLLTTLLASQENLHRTHLSAPLWTQMNSKKKKKKKITWSKPLYYTAKVRK